MRNSIPWPERPSGNRLERWLARKIQGGGLKALPRYVPVRGLAGHCSEEYARGLLAGLRRSEANLLTAERLKDDGRAFRSWAERALLTVVPHDVDRFVGDYSHGVAV